MWVLAHSGAGPARATIAWRVTVSPATAGTGYQLLKAADLLEFPALVMVAGLIPPAEPAERHKGGVGHSGEWR